MLFAKSLAIAPDAHRLFGFGGRRFANVDGAGDHERAVTLPLFGVGAERFARAFIMAPGAVRRLHGSKRVSSAVQQRQQRAKLDLGHGIRVDRGPYHASWLIPAIRI